MKFVILFCLTCSTVYLGFALFAEKDSLKTEKDIITVPVDDIKQDFASVNENNKTKYFGIIPLT
jgi:hypothetical protein